MKRIIFLCLCASVAASSVSAAEASPPTLTEVQAEAWTRTHVV
jgi:opacity protein-like surface antigen